MSIQRRKVFYDQTNGIASFWDWAIVTTTLGSMAEPFSANNRHQVNTPVAEYDPTDEIVRVDEIISQSSDKAITILSFDDGKPLNGGPTMPKEGAR